MINGLKNLLTFRWRTAIRSGVEICARSKTFRSASVQALRLRRRTPAAMRSIDDLDHAMSGVPSLNAFLADPEAIETYFQALVGYFGSDRFQRRSYVALLEQVRRLNESVPEFGVRAWAPAPDGSFDLETAGRSAGRDLDFALWKLYRFQWLASLKTDAGVPASIDARGVNALLSESDDFLRTTQANIRRFEAELTRPRDVKIARLELTQLRAEFYGKFQSDPAIRRLASLLLFGFLTHARNQHFFQLADPDLLILFFKDLKQNPRRVAETFPGVTIPSPVLTLIKAAIPSTHDLLANHAIFPLRTVLDSQGRNVRVVPTGRAVYRTRFIRSFHAIWLGVAENDCLAGDPQLLANLTPERWAVSALDGAVTAVLERNGRYQGYARAVPLVGPDGKIYASLEAWSSVLMSRIVLPGQNAQDRIARPFFDVWYPHFRRKLPRAWQGVVLSESVQIDNIGIKRTLRHSAHYTEGTVLCAATLLRHLDPLVPRIRAAVPPRDAAVAYGRDMIFDAKISDAGTLRLLADFPRSIKDGASARADSDSGDLYLDQATPT